MAFMVEPVTLVGRFIRLVPLGLDHAPGLCSVADRETFRYLPLAPTDFTIDGFRDYVKRRLEIPGASFAIELIETGEVVGSSALFDVRPEHRGLEIGHTWIAPLHRGTQVNPELKLLLIGHAIDDLKALRVQFKTDARNLASQAALGRLGAIYEGTLRNHMILPDGTIRDSAYYSVTPEDWPRIRTNLLDRLR